MAQVRALYRYPVKGLRPEAIERGEFTPGRGLLGDRAFAFQFLDDSVPAELRAAPEQLAPWMSKSHLLMQHDWPGLATVVPRWSAEKRLLRLSVDGGPSIEASVETADGRASLAEFMQKFLAGLTPFEKARHPQKSALRLIGSADLSSRYTDNGTGPVTFASEATFQDMSARLGFQVDWRSFRVNIILSSAEAWSELKWTGRKLRIGECILEVKKPLGRCPNIDVNPETGARDANIYSQLKPVFGHALTGMRAEVVQSGAIGNGDDWELL